MAPTIDCMRKGEFVWTPATTRAFEDITQKSEVPVLTHRDFSKAFNIVCDAFMVGIGEVLSQKGRFVAFFSEKRNETKQKYLVLFSNFGLLLLSNFTFGSIRVSIGLDPNISIFDNKF